MKKAIVSLLALGTIGAYLSVSAVSVEASTFTGEVETIGITARAVRSYVFNHRPPNWHRGGRLASTQYLGQGQYRGYYNF